VITRGRRSIVWRPRATPLIASAVLARGPAAARLIDKLLAEPARLSGLEGVSARGIVVLLGVEATLPWVDGVRYFGRDSAAPFLYLPTALEPDVPTHLLGGALPPALVLLDPEANELVPLEAALPVDAERLRAARC
jgi:hypothetical protein